MAIEDYCVSWSKLETLNAEPGFGANYSFGGAAPTYVPVKFNNGVYSNNIANHIYVTVADDVEDAGIIEIWAETDYSVTNGVPSDAVQHDFGVLWQANLAKVQLSVHPVIGINIQMFRNPTFIFTNGLAGVTWAANTPVHLLFVWDGAGIGGGANTSRIYVDGTLRASNNTAFGALALTPWIMYLNRRDAPPAGANAADGAVDNPKIYKDATISEQFITDILANRNNEAWPVTGAKRMIDSGIRSSMIDRSVRVA